ncbi:hypothetical protein V8C35DRAFT_269891 [Trichoderma chlorosporum]
MHSTAFVTIYFSFDDPLSDAEIPCSLKPIWQHTDTTYTMFLFGSWLLSSFFFSKESMADMVLAFDKGPDLDLTLVHRLRTDDTRAAFALLWLLLGFPWSLCVYFSLPFFFPFRFVVVMRADMRISMYLSALFTDDDLDLGCNRVCILGTRRCGKLGSSADTLFSS